MKEVQWVDTWEPRISPLFERLQGYYGGVFQRRLKRCITTRVCSHTMPPRKDPTNAQISSRLTYQAQTPAFLVQLQNRVAGIPDEAEDDDVDEFGRERPRQLTEPEGGGAGNESDEEYADEKPTVVVLKEGKHLNEEEAINEKRRGASTFRQVLISTTASQHGVFLLFSKRLATITSSGVRKAR